MRRIRILKCTREGNYIHVEGIEIIAVTQEEYEFLRDILFAEGYIDL